ncbi:Fe-S protein assembly chaperone HscA [Chondromyces apiculatus]|uniref:Chaperone protein HscA homolog n=1 Tax=Chondromyces apiculatus DSM 436 TaxID=1192034 RepID=A0A017T200_9BACT|nr:Fe-S protein assembly chaperone HscA [Chondromyces apiculatus]EYF03268.1 Chaperone protein HscA [Chondromyces apiculatus DSM 436]
MTLIDIFDPKARPTPIGIDLGTTNSLVARVRDGKPFVIDDCNGERLVPSVVHYDARGGTTVGHAAKRLAQAHPRETIVSVKRFMGRGADDPETRRLGPYEFMAPSTPEEAKSVRFQVRGRAVTPVEVSAELLKELRTSAERELRSVGPAVITVPAYFDDAQRQATKDAGRLAGLEVLRLLNEPTAAALAYGLDKQQNGLFAVYDLGGGTFDITVLLLDDGVFQVKSTGGDSALGGDDMDRALAGRLLAEMGVEGATEPEVVRLALDLARDVKHRLTESPAVEVEIPVAGSADATRQITVTRDEFDALVAPIVERTGVACRRALRDAGVQASELTGVILVGGSTRVPFVRSYVARIFGKEPLGDIDPDEVVALGAAIQADILAGSQERADEVLLLDVLPLSLGLETMGGVAEKILPRNTTIPTGARQTFTTYADNQTGFDLHIVQGEREMASDCRSLARFTLKGIPPMPAGLARLEVTFRVDADGLLSVTAKELTTGVEQKVEVKPSYGLTDEQVEEMLLAALDHGEEDLEQRRLVEGRVEADRVLLATRKALAADADLLEAGERERVEEAMTALEQAMKGTRAGVLQRRIEALDEATHGWAGRRMDRAVARAIAGRQVEDLESEVAHSKGVDQHVAEHRANAGGGG